MTHPTTELPLPDKLSQMALPYVLDGRVFADGNGYREFVVASKSRTTGYLVRYATSQPTCRCKTSSVHKHVCVHIRAVELAMRLDQVHPLATPPTPPKSEKFTIDTDVECSHCGSRSYRKDGPRKTKHGRNQMYECKNCGRRFSNDLGFARHQYPASIIEEALDLRLEGLSLAKVKRHLEKRYGMAPSLSAQYRWQRKFGKRFADYDEQNTPPLRDAWMADEQTLDIRGKKLLSWHFLDPRFRYWISNTTTRRKTTADGTKAILAAKEVAKGAPRLLVTDGNPVYPKVARKHLWRQNAPTTHIACPPIRSIKAKHGESKDKGVHLAQNRIERLNGFVRSRVDGFRGFKNLRAAQEFVRSLKAHYNLLRPHEALDGRTPAEAIGMRIPQMDGGTRLLAILIEQFKRERAQRRGVPPTPTGRTKDQSNGNNEEVAS